MSFHGKPAICIDKYYTNSRIVAHCLSCIQDIQSYDLVIDPGAGAGAFLNAVDHRNKVGIDILPEEKGILKADYLKYSIDKRYKKVLVIGNPPFGKHSLLSTVFLRHSFSFDNVKTIGFILPDIYRKQTRQRIIPDCWRIKSIVDIGKNAFYFNGKARHVPCSFFVFDRSKGDDLRVNPDKYTCITDFRFGNKDLYDFFIFGAAPRKITTTPQANNRGHFIKASIPVEELRQRFLNIQWRGNSCANGGVYWLTKTELLENYYRTYHK